MESGPRRSAACAVVGDYTTSSVLNKTKSDFKEDEDGELNSHRRCKSQNVKEDDQAQNF